MKKTMMIMAVLMALGATAAPSLIVVRQEEHLELNREKFKAILDIHRRHPGSCDEFWMSDRDFFRTFSDLTNHLAATEACRADFERAGVKIAFQQGYNLGHWYNGDIETFRAAYPKGAEIFVYDRDGRECEGFLCPRSPEVLERERKYVELVVRTIRPASYWIDDDLRLSFGEKPDGCYCARCIAAFNAKYGLKLTREELVKRIYSDEDREPLRAKWSAFNAESLAGYMAAAREGADRAGGKVLLGQESIWPELTYSGRDYFPRLRALSDGGRHEVGIRAGAGWWKEDSPRGMVEKALSVAREAERCRTAGFVTTVCYEEENFQRIVLNKSPGAIVTEAALGLASGCDTISLYFNDERIPEPIEEYERFAKHVAAARPYYEALAAASKRTRLAGLSRFVGSAADERRGFDFRDGSELPWALAGIPISVMEAEYPLWYVNETSRREMTPADQEKLAKGTVVELPRRRLDRPTQAERQQLLEAIDRATQGTFPVRVDACRPLRVLPRVNAAGELDCVTLLNCSIGETDELKVRIRRPVGAKAVWMQPGKAPVALKYEAGEKEGVLTVPSIAGWQIGTVFFKE